VNKKEHLPVIGVGPLFVIPQLILTVVSVVLSEFEFWDVGKVAILKIPLMIAGIAIIVLGIYLWYSANFKIKVDKYITENKLAITGIYAVVRNPIYSAFFMICIGIILFFNNLILFTIPLICWLYMTIFLRKTEEKWLGDLYGQEYIDYCKRVNRCIPWFSKK
jgi:protein-S-isoprenylcysteine O-methyltransferase Ste14